MKVEIKRYHIEKKPENKVTSHLIFTPHMRQKNDSFKFHPDGIFSKRIFGNFYKCACGERHELGICEKCGTRVIDRNHIPEFYVDLPCHVPVLFAKWDTLKVRRAYSLELAKNICSYNIFEYDGQFYFIGEDEIHLWTDANTKFEYDNFEAERAKIGLDALRIIADNADEFWEENTDDYVSILHTIYRPIVLSNGKKPIITNINALYSSLIQKINTTVELGDYAKDPIFKAAQYQKILSIYNAINESLFAEIQDVNYSIVKSEIISHPITGAIRAVLINRHDLDENVMLIGDTLIKTLFPYVYEKCNGNMVEINKALIETDSYVIVDRPPTICHLSIMSFKPRVASCYPFGHIEGTEGGLLHNEEYCKANADKIGIFKDREGDIERCSDLIDDGIDMLGLRCISVNPIVCDGYGADFDGDVLLVIALYSNKAKEEAAKILPSRTYINYANGTIRNHILKDFFLAYPDIDMNELESLPRHEYVMKNQEMAKSLWGKGLIPTIGDIIKHISNEDQDNDKFNAIFSLVGGSEEFTSMAAREDHDYGQEESSKHIENVMASNNTEISSAGYFYKLLMAAADDYRIVDSNCGSDGVEMKVADIDEDTYNYRVRYMYVNEARKYMRFGYHRFKSWLEGYDGETIHVRTPLTCNHMKSHGICRKCAGALPGNVNIGLFTTLMVTEKATQAALSSMNKGKKQNINDVIKAGYRGRCEWDAIIEWINQNVSDLQNPDVSARFYELAFLSRVREENGRPFVAGIKGSINYSGNLFGQYIFNTSKKDFAKMVNAGTFEDDSIKLKIAVNKFD